MISKTMEEQLNIQINKEMYSGFLYMNMSAQCTEMGLDGFAKWFMVQFHEEMFHAMKIYRYVHDQGGTVALKAVAAPDRRYKNVREMVEHTYEHEKTVTKSIHDLVDLAAKENDHASRQFLQWYVEEQVEEEKNPQDILMKMRFAEDDSPGLLFIDREVGARPLGVPSNFAEEG